MTFLLLTVYFIQSTVYCRAFGTFLDVLVQFQMFMDSLGCFWPLLDSLVQGNQGNVLKNTTSSCRQLRTSSRVSHLKEHDKEMGDRGGGKEISPNGDAKEAGWEVRESQEPPPPGPGATIHQELGFGIPQGGHGRKEAGQVEDGQRTEPREEEQKAPPASEEPRNSEAPPGIDGPQIPDKPPVPEGPQSPEIVEHERQGKKKRTARRAARPRARTGVSEALQGGSQRQVQHNLPRV